MPKNREEHLEPKIKPAEAALVRHIYDTYACMNCKENDIQTPVVQTPRVTQVIPGSFASPEAIAHIMVHKRLLQHEILHADKTTRQVLKEPGKAARTKSCMWLYRKRGCETSR